jgi:hypothetical protein
MWAFDVFQSESELKFLYYFWFFLVHSHHRQANASPPAPKIFQSGIDIRYLGKIGLNLRTLAIHEIQKDYGFRLWFAFSLHLGKTW